MKLEKLRVGMELKNYKELCRALEVKEQGGGNARKRQLEWFQEHFSFEKRGHRIIITEILKDKVEPMVDNRGGANNTSLKAFKELKVPEENFSDVGVYKMTTQNNIYIGSTTIGFREGFMRQRLDSRYRDTTTAPMFEHDELRFEIVEICRGMSEPEIRERQNYWIQHYSDLPEWNLLNSKPAWSLIPKTGEPKTKYKSIKVNISDFDKVIRYLKEEGIEHEYIKPKKQKRGAIK